MSVIPSQKFRFLGGVVAPTMYHSADMDQYGRWFSKADNIRFDTLGAFRNRSGFKKIAQTKYGIGHDIKLLSFSFSRTESYLIEMGEGYFRFFQNGEPIYIGGDPENGVYEVSHDMTIIEHDIKYAQSGDVLYLVNGVDPICTLTRNDTTGYNWTFGKFKFKDDCLPLGEVNTDANKTLSISETGSYFESWHTDISLGPGKYRNITLVINGYSQSTVDGQEYSGLAGLNTALTYLLTQFSEQYDLSVQVDASGITFTRSTSSVTITNISISSMQMGGAFNYWRPLASPLYFTQAVRQAAGAVVVNSSGFNFFDEKAVGDVLGVEFDIDAESATINGSSQTSVGTTSDVIKTNGRFAFQSTGNWQGEVVLEYSLDGSTNWNVFRTITSLNKAAPHNDNVAGTVTTDSDLIYMRIRITSALSHNTYPLNAFLMSEKFSVISYYKILSITSSSSAICDAIKNSFTVEVGQTISGLVPWREGVFSASLGYPSVIGFYQNRLIIGKEYMLYASKINEFDNFYEPSTLIANDPVTMSLLSYRYNRVHNILTVRKFFVFTEEGEFGIASQGALTQTDKNLIPLSYHGSNECLPILAGNLALFVDSSNRCVRLFQYTYETDSFEANDASVLLDQFWDGGDMVTTDYLKNTKEALFLDDSGTIWVFKLMPEQDIYAWSRWRYAGGFGNKITNMRVVFNGADEDLYIAVEDSILGEKRIEMLSPKDTVCFYDSSYTFTPDHRTRRFFTPFSKGTELVVSLENTDKEYKIVVGDNGLVELPEEADYIICHYVYTATATLLSPVQHITENAVTTYNKGKPFKVHFCYQDSFGFKVGVEEEDKMAIKFNAGDKPETTELTSGKRNVLIPARYDGSSRVTFIQDRPYNMTINNIMIDMDYGGK